jgi:hypothetical protein
MAMKRGMWVSGLGLIVIIAIFLSLIGGKLFDTLGPSGVKQFVFNPVNDLLSREVSRQDIINELSDDKIFAVTVIKENNEIELLILDNKLDQESVNSNTKNNEKTTKLSSVDLLMQIVSGSSDANAWDYPPSCPHSYDCLTTMLGGKSWHGCWCK